MTNMDRQAKFAAEYACEHQFHVHRGVTEWEGGITSIFGNDGYRQDPRTRRLVEVLRVRWRPPVLRSSGSGWTSGASRIPGTRGLSWSVPTPARTLPGS